MSLIMPRYGSTENSTQQALVLTAAFTTLPLWITLVASLFFSFLIRIVYIVKYVETRGPSETTS